MNKKILMSFILVIAMVFMISLVSLPAYADSPNYGIWLGNKLVKPSNKNDILGDGTAKYDPSTNTLTLYHPEIKGLSNDAQIVVAQSGPIDALTIKGFAELQNKDADYGILCIESDIKLDGTFDIYGKKCGILGWDIQILNGNLHVVGESEYGIDAEENVVFSMGPGVSIIEGGIEAVVSNDNLGFATTHNIIEPKNGYIYKDGGYQSHIYDENGVAAKYVKIGPKSSGGIELYYYDKFDGTDCFMVDAGLPGIGEKVGPYNNGYTFIYIWDGKCVDANSYWFNNKTGNALGDDEVIEEGVEYKLQIELKGDEAEKSLADIKEFVAGQKISTKCKSIKFEKIASDDDSVVLTAYYKIGESSQEDDKKDDEKDDEKDGKKDDKSDGKSDEKGDKDKDSSGNNGSKDDNKYSNEWINGQWYDANGKADYSYKGSWKSDATGWWFEDEKGWYPAAQWLKIDGKWYYFCADGYMDYSEYRDGCWLGDDGAWVEEYYGGHWMNDATGWWYEDASGWYPVSKWVWIDGSCYYFGSDGYMATSTYIDGCWVGVDGAWVK